MSRFNEEKVREALSHFQEELRQKHALYAEPVTRQQLLGDAREQIRAAHGCGIAFAFSTSKGFESVYSVRPDLAGAVDAARSRYAEPTWMITVTAWFPDGSSYEIPWEFLCRFSEQLSPIEWIGRDEARELTAQLFSAEARNDS